MDQLARAYAVLGLDAGCSASGVRRRYRELARRWHPDRYGHDPQGQAEATEQMRIINEAFREVARSRTCQVAERHPAPHRPSGSRLSREAVDRMVEGIGTDGPVNWLLDAFRLDWPTQASQEVSRLRMSMTIAFGLATIAEVGRQWAGIGSERTPWPWLPPVTFVVATVVLGRTLPGE